MEFRAGRGGIESGLRRTSQREEVGVHQTTPRLGRKFGTERHESAPVPADNRLEGFDHHDGAHMFVPQRGLCGVAETQAADHDVERSGQCGERQVGQGNLHLVEHAGHEKSGTQRYFVHLEVIKRGHPSPPQGEVADRRALEIELLEKTGWRAGWSHCLPDCAAREARTEARTAFSPRILLPELRGPGADRRSFSRSRVPQWPPPTAPVFARADRKVR